MSKWGRVIAEQGVICGADAHQEWLLPWWWERYTACNNFPVAFVDFGMTETAKQWCRARGEYIALDRDASFLFPKSAIAQKSAAEWEERYYGRQLWQMRGAWFKKPFALLHSPFEKGIWVDLDCEVLRPLAPLFPHCTSETPLALVREYPVDSLYSSICCGYNH